MTSKELKTKYPKSFLAHDKAILYIADENSTKGILHLDKLWVANKKDNLEEYIEWNK